MVVSGSPDAAEFMSGSLDVCLHLSPNSHLSPRLAGDVRSPDICLHLSPFICLPVWQVVSGSFAVCLHLSPNSFVPRRWVAWGSKTIYLRHQKVNI